MTVGEGREHRSLIAFGMTEERRLGNDNKKSPFFWTGFFCGDGGSRKCPIHKGSKLSMKEYIPKNILIIKSALQKSWTASLKKEI